MPWLHAVEYLEKIQEIPLNDKKLVQISLYAALIAAMGLVPPIPFATGIPITLQTLGVMLAGVMLGPWRGFLAVMLFVFVVALGLPVLSGGRGGLGVFAGPTAGFILGFPVAALVTGLVAQLLGKLNLLVAASIGAFVGGILVLYLFGITGFKLITGREWMESITIMMVYMPGDLVKVIATALIAQSVYRAMPSAVAIR